MATIDITATLQNVELASESTRTFYLIRVDRQGEITRCINLRPVDRFPLQSSVAQQLNSAFSQLETRMKEFMAAMPGSDTRMRLWIELRTEVATLNGAGNDNA